VLLYTHKADADHVAVSEFGDIASGAYDGSVMVYENATGVVRTARNPHADRVGDIFWRDNELHTSSWDGTARTWTRELTVKSSRSFEQSLRDMVPLKSGWVGSPAGTRLRLHTLETDLELDIGGLARDLSVSSDSRFAAAVAAGELIVLDVENRALAAIQLMDKSANCARFVDATTIFICSSSEVIFAVSVHKLPFVKMDIERRISNEQKR